MKLDDKTIVMAYMRLMKLYKDPKTVYFHMSKLLNHSELVIERHIERLKAAGVKLP